MHLFERAVLIENVRTSPFWPFTRSQFVTRQLPHYKNAPGHFSWMAKEIEAVAYHSIGKPLAKSPK
jgi:hypothetical protein